MFSSNLYRCFRGVPESILGEREYRSHVTAGWVLNVPVILITETTSLYVLVDFNVFTVDIAMGHDHAPTTYPGYTPTDELGRAAGRSCFKCRESTLEGLQHKCSFAGLCRCLARPKLMGVPALRVLFLVVLMCCCEAGAHYGR